jgi:hypothetical protein
MNKLVIRLVLLMLLFASVPAFAQKAEGGGNPTPVPVAPACFGDRILIGSVSASAPQEQGSVYELCKTKDSLIGRMLLEKTPGVETILASQFGTIYAMSSSQAWKYTDYGVSMTRIMAGGFRSDADPLVVDEYGTYIHNSITVSFPGNPKENEKYKLWVYGDGSSYTQKAFEEDVRGICAYLVSLSSSDEYCLDVVNHVVFQPNFNLFSGLNYKVGKEWFAGRNPVNMVAGKDGSIYVLLASPPLPTVGKPSPTVQGALAGIIRTRSGEMVERTLVQGLPISPDMRVQSMTAGQLGIYLITTNGQSSTLWLYSYGSGALTNLGTSMSGQVLSGMTVAP